MDHLIASLVKIIGSHWMAVQSAALHRKHPSQSNCKYVAIHQYNLYYFHTKLYTVYHSTAHNEVTV